jgi:tight adherence protein B
MNSLIFMAVAFCGVFLIVGVLLIWLTTGRWRLGRRIEAMSGKAASQGREAAGKGHRPDLFPTITGLLQRADKLGALTRQIERSGLRLRPSEFAAGILALSAALLLLDWAVLRTPLSAAAAALLGVLIPLTALKALQAQRLRKFEQQLPDGLMVIASSLRSGYSVMRAIQTLAQEMGPPISDEFSKALDEINVGAANEVALRHLAERVRSYDLDLVATAMLIQLQVGGNLAHLMETVAETIRERQRIRGEINILTAEARLSGMILFLLPVAMGFILTVLNRNHMIILFTTGVGHVILGVAAALMLLGGVVINRMLQLDV